MKKSLLIQFVGCFCAIFLLPTGARTEAENPAIQSGVANDRGYVGYTTRYEVGEDTFGRIRILQVHPGSPAEKAGLKPHDLILAIDGARFKFSNDLDMARGLNRIKADIMTVFTVERGATTGQIPVLPIELPSEMRQALVTWMGAAEIWFEQGKGERCRERRNSTSSTP